MLVEVPQPALIQNRKWRTKKIDEAVSQRLIRQSLRQGSTQSGLEEEVKRMTDEVRKEILLKDRSALHAQAVLISKAYNRPGKEPVCPMFQYSTIYSDFPV